MPALRYVFPLIIAAVLVTEGLRDSTAEAAGSCDAIPGVWSWFVNGEVTFQPNGTLVQGPRTGRWTCANGQVIIAWSHGFTDRLTLSANGRSMQGTNEDGAAVWGTRRNDGNTPQPAMVFENCRVTPCVLGVADPSYALPGNQRCAEGWRRFNTNPYPLTDFPDHQQAWRFACRIHHSSPRHSAPDIVDGRIDCAALCGGNARCP